jgi:hypothetical protein
MYIMLSFRTAIIRCFALISLATDITIIVNSYTLWLYISTRFALIHSFLAYLRSLLFYLKALFMNNFDSIMASYILESKVVIYYYCKIKQFYHPNVLKIQQFR